MKRIFCIVLAVLICGAVVACGEAPSTTATSTQGQLIMTEEELQATIDEAVASALAAQTINPVIVEATPEPTEAPTPVPVEEQLLMDASGLQVFYTGYDPEASFSGPGLNVKIVNNTDQDWTVQVRDFSIDNLLVVPIFSSDVPAGKTANSSIVLNTNDLIKNGITTIGDVEFKFHYYLRDGWSGGGDTEPITISVNQPVPVVES